MPILWASILVKSPLPPVSSFVSNHRVLAAVALFAPGADPSIHGSGWHVEVSLQVLEKEHEEQQSSPQLEADHTGDVDAGSSYLFIKYLPSGWVVSTNR